MSHNRVFGGKSTTHSITSPGRAAIEVAPWSGLLPRWRFVIPADYEGVVTWGIGPPGAAEVSFDAVRRPTRHGPVQLTDGPVVEWLGGHNPLSPSLSAYLVIDGDPPHYLAFGQSEEPDAPPASLEGIYFAAHEHPQNRFVLIGPNTSAPSGRRTTAC